MLAAASVADLHTLMGKARSRGISYTEFREPDLCDELTAIAFGPGDATRRLLSNLPLAGRRLADQGPLLQREAALRELADNMRSCEQTPGQDTLAHGRSVREHYFALLEHLDGTHDLSQAPNWKLPEWLTTWGPQLLAATLPRAVMDEYTTLHDAGKYAVREVGDDGKQRFPGHADSSRRCT